jgi:hypothetical protein
MKTEHFVWAAFAADFAAIFWVSDDGFYRYPCQDPANWAALECTPPICTRTKMCANDLTGALE